MTTRRLVAGAAALFLATSCASSSPTGPIPATTVTVFAASSLTEAFDRLGVMFDAAHPDVMVDFNFAASDTLATQIDQGAPADVFAAAGPAPMDEVVSKHHADGTPAVFVTNKLVVIAPRSNPARIHSVADLATNGVKVVLAAAGVPAGDYARQMFEGLGIGKDVAHNVVSNEIDDKSVVAKVLLGDADAGVVYVTDLTPDVQSKVTAIQIPAHDNVIASYPIAPVTGGDNLADGRLFVRFVLSAEGRRVLDAAGFGSP